MVDLRVIPISGGVTFGTHLIDAVLRSKAVDLSPYLNQGGASPRRQIDLSEIVSVTFLSLTSM